MRPVILAAWLVLAAGPASAEGDPARGARVFQRCYACHSVDPAETNLQGPNLSGVLGRRAGSLAGFDYSEAMEAAGRAGVAWDARTLDAFMADPEALVPGTTMGPIRIPEPADRLDLIAYLRHHS